MVFSTVAKTTVFTRLFLQIVLYLKGAHQLTLVLLPGRWSWTAKCWRWWTIKRFQTLKEVACLRPNICSSPVTRWPSSSLQMPKLQAASDLWSPQHGPTDDIFPELLITGLKWLELWCCFIYPTIFPPVKIVFLFHTIDAELSYL